MSFKYPACLLVLIAALALAACANDASRHSAAAIGATEPDGATIFRKYCVACHGADGKLGLNGAKDLTKTALTLEERISLVTKGKSMMTPFGEILNPEEIRAVAAYTETFRVAE
ncbi:MAG: cytochrome c [Saprospiraceae bacterium]|nr:cytochrome c [Saprospiraceae bacterium]